MSNVSRRFRRRRARSGFGERRAPRYSMTVCADPDPNCPTCQELLRQPGARCEESNGLRTILVPLPAGW